MSRAFDEDVRCGLIPACESEVKNQRSLFFHQRSFQALPRVSYSRRCCACRESPLALRRRKGARRMRERGGGLPGVHYPLRISDSINDSTVLRAATMPAGFPPRSLRCYPDQQQFVDARPNIEALMDMKYAGAAPPGISERA